MRNKKTIVFRVDASQEIGWGHLMRELALAERFKKDGNIIIFASIKDFSNEQIKKADFKLFLKRDKEIEEVFLDRIKNALSPDIIIFDGHFQYNSDFLKNWKAKKIKVVMIDDFCEGLKAADEIIFPNAHLNRELLKKSLSPEEIRRVRQGFDYVILRDEILELRKEKKQPGERKDIVLITGGTDPEGVLLKLLSWLREIDLNANIFALFGRGFSFPEQLRKIKKDLPSNFRIQPYSLREIVKADIAVCTFGQSVYELIYLGIPTICLSHNRENAQAAKILAKRYKVIKDIGYFKELSSYKLSKAVKSLLFDKSKSELKDLVDGQGVNRIADIILSSKNALISIAAGKSQELLIKKIRQRGFSVIGVDRNPRAPGLKLCDERIIESTDNPARIIRALKKLKKKYHFSGIITHSSGLPVITTAKIARHFNLRYVSPEIAQKIVDKGSLLKELNKKNILAPKVKVVSSDNINNISLVPPYFVKPSICHKSHTAMTKVDDYEGLESAVKRALEVSQTGWVNIEEYISGIDLVSIDWVFNKKIIPVAVIEEINSGPPYFYGLGWKIPVSAKIEKIVKSYQKRFIETMEINNSLVQTAMKFDGKKPYIYEVHLDPGGDGIPDILLPRSLNYDLLDNAINLAIGRAPEKPLNNPKPFYLKL